MTLLSSLKLGKPFGISKNGFQIPAETLLGNRNWGFLESPVTYLIYLNLSIVITNWISRDIKQTTNLRTLNWFTLVVALEIAFLAYNQNPLKVDQYRSIPWTQTSKFDFADKSRVFDTWIDSWPWVYNSGEFGKNNFLFTPVSFTQKSDIEKSRFKMKVANLEINAPNPLNPYTNWGSDVKKINILSLILGSTSDRPHFLQKLRLFTEEYKGKGFRFTEKFADGTIIIKDFPKTYIQEMTNLNRGGVPQRYLMIPKSTAHFLNSVEGEEGDSYVVDLLKRTPVFISNSISVVNNSNHLINSYNSGNIFPLEKTELREGHYRFSNLKEGCSFIISQNINTIRIESLLGCVGKNLVLRTAWSRNWKVSQGEASIAKISDFLLGIQIPKRTKQNDTIIVRYENTLYKYLVYIRFLIQISLFSWALYLSLSKRGKRFGILRR